MIKEDIIGKYYTLKYRTKVEAHEYSLEIAEVLIDKLNFTLNHTVSGHFGSLGEEWIGYCKIENKLSFKTYQFIDWRYTFLDDERQDMVSTHDKTYLAEVFIEGEDVSISLNMETQNLVLYKAHPKVELYTAQITQEIMKKFRLDNEYGKYDEPGKFWRISNLILKDLQENQDIEELELTCEYDLDTVKEEKRVVNADEVVRKHHKAIITFQKNKITSFLNKI